MTADQKYLIESIVKDIIYNITEDFKISITSSASLVYNSDTIAKLFDISTWLYTRSTLYVYDMFLQEVNMGKMGREY